MRKLNFIEWYQKEENSTNEWAKKAIESMFKSIIKKPVHHGDCTWDSDVCILCLMETLLCEYYEYFKS